MIVNMLTNAQFWITILIALLSFQLGRDVGRRETINRFNKVIEAFNALCKTAADNKTKE